jgi:hypothetical protein
LNYFGRPYKWGGFLYLPDFNRRPAVLGVHLADLHHDDLCIILVGESIERITDDFYDIIAIRFLGRFNNSAEHVRLYTFAFTGRYRKTRGDLDAELGAIFKSEAIGRCKISLPRQLLIRNGLIWGVCETPAAFGTDYLWPSLSYRRAGNDKINRVHFVCRSPFIFFHLADTNCEVIFMYQDLHELLMSSDVTRQFFMKLPVHVQMTVHQQNDQIRTVEDLHQYVDHMTKVNC